MSRIFYACCLAPLIAVFGMSIGCQEQTPYETQKPLIDEDLDNDGVDDDLENDIDNDGVDDDIENDIDQAGDNMDDAADDVGDTLEEAGEDVADAVTPDRDLFDAETPIGNVNVREDPVTGDKKVDIEADNPDDQ